MTLTNESVHHGLRANDSPKQTLAIILNWNDLNLTRRCLESLRDNDLCDVLVIDNGSIEDPTTILQEEFPGVVVLRNEKNLGVAGGRSAGLYFALNHSYEFVLIFDNDAIASPTMLEKLLRAAENYPNAGIFGPKIMRLDRPERIWRAGCTSWKLTYLHTFSEALASIAEHLKWTLPKYIDWSRGANQNDTGRYDAYEFIDFQIGCAQLIRQQVLVDVGVFDTRFSPYGAEDIDFCVRATSAGWKILYVPDAKCWHRVGSSVPKGYQRTYYNTRNILLVARKNLSTLYFWGLFVPDYVFFRIPLTILYFSVTRRSTEKLRGFRDGIIWNVYDSIKSKLNFLYP